MSYGRFKGGQHFNSISTNKLNQVDKATPEQLKELKELNITIEKNLTSIRAKYLIKEAKKQ